MSAQPKRRERVKRVADARRAPPMRYWLTRDRDVLGTLSDRVSVWLIRPERTREGLGSRWRCDDLTLPSADGPVPARHGTWSLAEATKYARTYPDDETMLIVVGNRVKA